MERDLSTLQLPGQTGRAAINRMMAEGYRCGLEPGKTLAPGLPVVASIACSLETRRRDNECPTLRMTIYLQWDEAEASLSTLFERLTTSKVDGLHGFCIGPPLRSSTYLTAKKSAETELSHKFAGVVTVGESAESAFESLLIQDFQCGLQFAREPAAGPHESAAPQMRCTRLPSTTENCYQEELWLDVTWRDPTGAPEQLVRQFADAQVAGIHAVCGLPLIDTASVAWGPAASPARANRAP